MLWLRLSNYDDIIMHDPDPVFNFPSYQGHNFMDNDFIRLRLINRVIHNVDG